MRREYTGDWINDTKFGRGTMFFKNGDRYDGMWLNDSPHGEGRMIYANGDVYEGFFHLSKRCGYGVLTKRNGDHFEGQWVNDKREGQGSYYFMEKNQVYVGEWVDDIPKAGVFSEVDDNENPVPQRENDFTEPYIPQPFPSIKLKNPTEVLNDAMMTVKKDRTLYRAKYLPLDELFKGDDLNSLIEEFNKSVDQNGFNSFVNVISILYELDLKMPDEDVNNYLQLLISDYSQEEIDFEVFARLVAIVIEDSNSDAGLLSKFLEEKSKL